MRQFSALPLLAIGAIVFLGGCNSNNEGKIEGTRWSSLEMNVQGQSVPAGTLRLEFKKDGKMAYVTPVGNFNGSYDLGWGDNVTLNLDRELAGRKSHTESIVVNGERMTVTDTDGTAAEFRLMSRE